MKMPKIDVDNGNFALEDDDDVIDDNDDIVGGNCKHNEAYSPPLKFAVTGTLLTRGPI